MHITAAAEHMQLQWEKNTTFNTCKQMTLDWFSYCRRIIIILFSIISIKRKWHGYNLACYLTQVEFTTQIEHSVIPRRHSGLNNELNRIRPTNILQSYLQNTPWINKVIFTFHTSLARVPLILGNSSPLSCQLHILQWNKK